MGKRRGRESIRGETSLNERMRMPADETLSRDDFHCAGSYELSSRYDMIRRPISL